MKDKIIILTILFYVIMFVLYLYANGNLGKSEKYIEWTNNEGIKLKKNILILVVLYTLAQILSLL